MRQPADGLYQDVDVEVPMQSRPRIPGEPVADSPPGTAALMSQRHDAELEAIALLCLVFAWPQKPNPPQATGSAMSAITGMRAQLGRDRCTVIGDGANDALDLLLHPKALSATLRPQSRCTGATPATR